MLLALLSFFAGVVTVTAPCVFPLLPVILGNSVSAKDPKKALIIIASLAVSVVLFSVLLKATTLLIMVDPLVWKLISGGLLVVMGAFFIFPHVWEEISVWLKLSSRADQNLDKANKKEGVLSYILIGAALGPVFTSCSPTYALIVASILPVSFAEGLVYISLYALGLSSILLLIAILGRRLTSKLKWVSDPNGWFKKVLGIVLLLVGLAVVFGLDKQFETWLVASGFADWSIQLESQLLENR